MMTFLLAILITVVAFSLMATVLVATTRTLKAFDEPVFGAHGATRARTHPSGPNWMDMGHSPRQARAIQAPHPAECPVPAFQVPETTGSRAAPRSDTMPSLPAPRHAGRINPNTWGRVRAEVGMLKTVAHIRNAG